MSEDNTVWASWNVEYYFKNNKLFTYISLGTGKTESNDWYPEEIFSFYERRMNELKKVKKTSWFRYN
jgi:hypothetical protein